jgi:hypothetical protein
MYVATWLSIKVERSNPKPKNQAEPRNRSSDQVSKAPEGAKKRGVILLCPLNKSHLPLFSSTFQPCPPSSLPTPCPTPTLSLIRTRQTCIGQVETTNPKSKVPHKEKCKKNHSLSPRLVSSSRIKKFDSNASKQQ